MEVRGLNEAEIIKAVDIHSILDKLETFSNVEEYYKINHLSAEQINDLATKIAELIITELKALGLEINNT